MKKWQLRIFCVFLGLAFLLAFSNAANAEIYMKQKRHTDETKVMGKTQPAKDEIVITWLGK